MLRAAKLVTAAGLILLAGFLLGCGSSDSSSTGDEGSFGPNIVTDSDIEAQQEGSPERALLEWWQAYQFGDAEQVVARTSKDLLDKVGENNLSELVKNTGQGLQGIEVLGATEEGNTASVRVGLLTFTPEKEGQPPPDEPTSSTPDTFAMHQEGGEWRFAADDYLVPKLESFQQSQQQKAQSTTTTTSTK